MSNNSKSKLDVVAALAHCDLTPETMWCMDLRLVQQHVLTRRIEQYRGRQMTVAPQQRGGIAVLDIRGVLMHRAEYYDEIDMGLLSDAFRSLAGNDDIAAVVLNIDSPGGTCAGMPNLMAAADELASAKPLVSFVEHVCCSAAYCLAAKSQKIFAGQRTRIGSVGTRMMLYDFSKYFADLGVEAIAIDTGIFKSMGAMGTEITEEHRKYLQACVDTLQGDFRSVVQSGRNMDDAAYEKISDARVLFAEESIDLSLIDGVSSLAETITAAATLATPKPTTTKTRSNAMDPVAATLEEMQENIPGATDSFYIEQLGKKSTLQGATKAFFAVQKAATEKLEQEKQEAIDQSTKLEKEKAEAEEKLRNKGTTTTTQTVVKKKGAAPLASNNSEKESEEGTDYVAMAKAIAKEEKISFRDACQRVKKLHPESRASFVGSVLQG